MAKEGMRNVCPRFVFASALACVFASGVACACQLQRALTLILLQKCCDTNRRRIVLQIGGVYTTFYHEVGILLQQKYRDRSGRVYCDTFPKVYWGQGENNFDKPQPPKQQKICSQDMP